MQDAPYVLSDVLDNETELPLLERTTDTVSSTEIVFALFRTAGPAILPADTRPWGSTAVLRRSSKAVPSTRTFVQRAEQRRTDPAQLG
jgi:hypothetical protein